MRVTTNGKDTKTNESTNTKYSNYSKYINS